VVGGSRAEGDSGGGSEGDPVAEVDGELGREGDSGDGFEGDPVVEVGSAGAGRARGLKSRPARIEWVSGVVSSKKSVSTPKVLHCRRTGTEEKPNLLSKARQHGERRGEKNKRREKDVPTQASGLETK
jgi:hypothetical protein